MNVDIEKLIQTGMDLGIECGLMLLEARAGAGISIPFPQQDVHMCTHAPESSG
jgi:hypothetical protein